MLIKPHRLLKMRSYKLSNTLEEHRIGHPYENQQKFIATDPCQTVFGADAIQTTHGCGHQPAGHRIIIE